MIRHQLTGMNRPSAAMLYPSGVRIQEFTDWIQNVEINERRATLQVAMMCSRGPPAASRTA